VDATVTKQWGYLLLVLVYLSSHSTVHLSIFSIFFHVHIISLSTWEVRQTASRGGHQSTLRSASSSIYVIGIRRRHSGTSHDQPSHNCANCLRTTHPQSAEGTCCPNTARAVRADSYTLHTVYELMCLCMYVFFITVCSITLCNTTC
jgi:hypothetical protein